MMIEYPQGFGRRDPVPVCEPLERVIACPCCEGDAGHSYGKGMDTDSVDCTTCNGWGYFVLTEPTKGDGGDGN